MINMDDLSETKFHVSVVLEKIGWYQQRLVLMMAYVSMFVGGMMTSLPVFTAAEPGWGCVTNSSACNVTGMFIPTDKNYNLRCDLDRHDWKFEDSLTSIITEWDLVCEKSILQSVAQSMVFVGWFVGLILFGLIADKYGRKPVLFVCSMIAICSSFITSFSPTIWFYIIGRFITGLGIGGCLMAMVILPAEFSSNPRHRGASAILPWMGWNLSNEILPLAAYFVRAWRHLILVVTVPGALIVFLWWFVDESPRWLMVASREEEARRILNKVAKVNKREMPPGKLLPVLKEENSKNGNVLDLFRNRNFIKITLTMWFIWFAASLQSYGVMFASVAMTESPYLNYAIIGTAGGVSMFLCIFLQETFGRRKAIMLTLLTAFIFSLISVFLPTTGQDEIVYKVGQTICFFIIKVAAVSAFDINYVYAAEVYPTTVRNVGMSWCSAMARVGSFVSPYIIWLQRYHASIPMSIMGACSLAASLMILTLKETKRAPTLETFAEMDELNVRDRATDSMTTHF